MLPSLKWRLKAREFATKAQTTADDLLRLQYAELADRCLRLAHSVERMTHNIDEVGPTAADAPGGPMWTGRPWT
jgi:hypothetical protein